MDSFSGAGEIDSNASVSCGDVPVRTQVEDHLPEIAILTAMPQAWLKSNLKTHIIKISSQTFQRRHQFQNVLFCLTRALISLIFISRHLHRHHPAHGAHGQLPEAAETETISAVSAVNIEGCSSPFGGVKTNSNVQPNWLKGKKKRSTNGPNNEKSANALQVET